MTKKLNIATHLHCFFSLSFSLLASPPQAAVEGRPLKALFLFAAKFRGTAPESTHGSGLSIREPELLSLLLGLEPPLAVATLGEGALTVVAFLGGGAVAADSSLGDGAAAAAVSFRD